MNSLADSIHATPNTRMAECAKHGEFSAKNFFGTIWTRCPVCAAAEMEKAELEEAEAKREAGIRAWNAKVGQAGIPERFRERSLKTFIASNDAQAAALKFAAEYADKFDDVLKTGRSALFIGKPGTGKTHLAAGIGLRIMHRNNRTVLMTTVMRAIRRVKDTWTRGSDETETQAIDALVFPDLLILDELGIQFGSETEKMMLFDVLNARYEQRKPTLLLSNLTLEEASAYLGDRVFDRLREDGGESIVFDWASHRGAA